MARVHAGFDMRVELTLVFLGPLSQLARRGMDVDGTVNGMSV
jgi:hypothetical protein